MGEPLETFRESMETSGLWPLIMISKINIAKQSLLFDCLLRLWAPSCNAFIFSFGLMSITLYDIIYLVGLPVLGPNSTYFIDDSVAPIDSPRYCYPSYRVVVREWGTNIDILSSTEHTMFLWVLICHYIFCPSSGRPSSEYLSLFLT